MSLHLRFSCYFCCRYQNLCVMWDDYYQGYPDVKCQVGQVKIRESNQDLRLTKVSYDKYICTCYKIPQSYAEVNDRTCT